MSARAEGPLAGLRVLDISTLIAGPFAATLLADFGAAVVKAELPHSGDVLRTLPPYRNGVGLWWKVTGRNKKGITLDFRKARGQELLKRLIPHFDVLVENFRPGTLERWGLGIDVLQQLNPGLVILRVSAFGQTGPYRSKPGFARIAEAASGFTYICGEPDRAPLHVGFPIADGVTGLFGAFGILMVLYHRLRNPNAPGQVIDLALSEAMFRMLDFLAIEYDQLGMVRERSGNQSQYAAPGNVYRTADGQWVTIPASSQSIFERLVRALGKPELIADPKFASNPARVAHRDALDAILMESIGAHTMAELRAALDQAEVAFSPIYSVADIFADPQVKAREAIIAVEDDELGTVRMQSVVPRLSATPGHVHSAGPPLGRDNDEIYRGLLGLSDEEIRGLAEADVI